MLISIGELIKRSYNLYKDNFVIILKYLLLLLVPAIILFAFMGLAMLPALAFGSAMGPMMFILIPLLLLVLLVITVLGMWFNFALIRVIDLLNKKMTVPPMKDVLKEAKTVVWRGFGTTILIGLYTAWPLFLGLCGFAISSFVLGPSIAPKIIFGLIALYGIFHLAYFSIKLIFSVYATVIDNKKIKESMELSKSLTQKRWWGIVGRTFVPMLVVYIIVLIVYTILATIGEFGGDTGKWIATALYSIINFLIAPYPLAVVVILFDEAKKTPVLTAPQA